MGERKLGHGHHQKQLCVLVMLVYLLYVDWNISE